MLRDSLHFRVLETSWPVGCPGELLPLLDLLPSTNNSQGVTSQLVIQKRTNDTNMNLPILQILLLRFHLLFHSLH